MTVDIDRAALVFKALAHTSRVRIVKELLEGEKCVLEIKDLVSISQPNISQHLNILKNAGLVDFRQEGRTSRFSVLRPGHDAALAVELNLAGRHNARNALAAVAIAQELEIPDEAPVRALAGFGGIDRRMQIVGELPADGGSALLVDDYGHHPTELECTIDAIRSAWPDRRLVVAFQPHRYSRTRDLMDDFARVLAPVDALVLCDVYSAGEEPIPGADGRALARAIRIRGQVEPVFVENVEHLADALPGVLHDGDIVVTFGAGSIGAASARLPADMGGSGERGS